MDKNLLPDILIQRLLLKKKLLEENNSKHKEIKTALIIGGGGMRGVYAAGVVEGLQKAELSDVFDIVAGVSAGAVSTAYFLSHQADIVPSICYDDLASKKFINFFNPKKSSISITPIMCYEK